jgi:hypothetical protein
MKLNPIPIKQKILEATQQERITIQNMYQESCKKANRLAWRNRLLFFLCGGAFIYSMSLLYHSGYLWTTLIICFVVFFCSAPFLGMYLSGETSFYGGALDTTLQKNKEYHATIKSVEDKKNQIVRSDREMGEYMIFLKRHLEFWLYNEYFPYVEIFQDEKHKALREKKNALRKRIEAISSEKEFFIFDKVYTDVHFSFSFTYTNKSLLGAEKTLTIWMDEKGVENGYIQHLFWENTW